MGVIPCQICKEPVDTEDLYVATGYTKLCEACADNVEFSLEEDSGLPDFLTEKEGECVEEEEKVYAVQGLYSRGGWQVWVSNLTLDGARNLVKKGNQLTTQLRIVKISYEVVE